MVTNSTFQPKLLKCSIPSGLEQLPNNAVRLLQVSLYHGDLPTILAEGTGQRRAQHSRSHNHNLVLAVKVRRSRFHVLALWEGGEKGEGGGGGREGRMGRGEGGRGEAGGGREGRRRRGGGMEGGGGEGEREGEGGGERKREYT